MSTIPVIKQSSGGEKQQRRNVVGLFLGFEQDKDGNSEIAKIRVISPGGKMGDKVALMGLEDIGELGMKRTNISVRVPGKTEKIRGVEFPLKTDWNTDKTVVHFEGAYFSGKGDGEKDTPYQMSARWSKTLSPEAGRILTSESIRVRGYKDKDSDAVNFSVTTYDTAKSFTAETSKVTTALDHLVAESAAAKTNNGATLVAFDKDSNGIAVMEMRSFLSYDKETKTVVRPSGEALFAAQVKKSGIDLKGAAAFLVIPTSNHSMSENRWLDDDQRKDFARLAALSVDKDGGVLCRSGVLAMSPVQENGMAYVGNVVTLTGGHNPIERAMLHNGLIQEEDANQGRSQAQPQSGDKHEQDDDDGRFDYTPSPSDEEYSGHFMNY